MIGLDEANRPNGGYLSLNLDQATWPVIPSSRDLNILRKQMRNSGEWVTARGLLRTFLNRKTTKYPRTRRFYYELYRNSQLEFDYLEVLTVCKRV